MAFVKSVVGLNFFLPHFAFSKSKKCYVLPLLSSSMRICIWDRGKNYIYFMYDFHIVLVKLSTELHVFICILEMEQ